jgi:hypothetical protein
MAFKVRIGFTGVCSFVINSDTTGRKVRACVVMPDAEGRGDKQHTSKKAPDGERLLRHRAYLKFKLQQLVSITNKLDVPVDSEGLVYIEGYRVSFKIPDAERLANPFTADPTFRNHLLSMEEVAGVYADDFDEIVKPSPAANLIAAQVLIDSGTLKYDPQPGDPPLETWIVPNNLTGKIPPLSKALTHEMALGLSNISELVVVLQPLGGGNPDEIKLKPVATEPVEISIAHLCSENPLRWKTTDVDQKADVDFKWHYMLFSLATRDSLTRNILGGLQLPIPLPRFQGAAQGANCPPSIAKDRDFNLD